MEEKKKKRNYPVVNSKGQEKFIKGLAEKGQKRFEIRAIDIPVYEDFKEISQIEDLSFPELIKKFNELYFKNNPEKKKFFTD